MPYSGNPDESLFPPSKGVGDNVNRSREEEESRLSELLDAVCADDAVRIRLLSGQYIDVRLET